MHMLKDKHEHEQEINQELLMLHHYYDEFGNLLNLNHQETGILKIVDYLLTTKLGKRNVYEIFRDIIRKIHDDKNLRKALAKHLAEIFKVFSEGNYLEAFSKIYDLFYNENNVSNCFKILGKEYHPLLSELAEALKLLASFIYMKEMESKYDLSSFMFKEIFENIKEFDDKYIVYPVSNLRIMIFPNREDVKKVVKRLRGEFKYEFVSYVNLTSPIEIQERNFYSISDLILHIINDVWNKKELLLFKNSPSDDLRIFGKIGKVLVKLDDIFVQILPAVKNLDDRVSKIVGEEELSIRRKLIKFLELKSYDYVSLTLSRTRPKWGTRISDEFEIILFGEKTLWLIFYTGIEPYPYILMSVPNIHEIKFENVGEIFLDFFPLIRRAEEDRDVRRYIWKIIEIFTKYFNEIPDEIKVDDKVLNITELKNILFLLFGKIRHELPE